METIWPALVGLAIGAVSAYALAQRRMGEMARALSAKSTREAEAEIEAARLLDDAAERARLAVAAAEKDGEARKLTAELEAREVAEAARAEASRLKAEAEAEAKAASERQRLADDERRRADEARLEKRESLLLERERALLEGERALAAKGAELERAVTAREAELDRVTAAREAEQARTLAQREAELARAEAARQTEAARAEAAREAEAARAAAAREAESARFERERGERERLIAEREREAARLVSEQRARLEALAGMSGEEARRKLLEQHADEARRASAREAKAIEDAARDEAEKRAKRIVGIAIQRYAGDHVQERSVSSVHLPSDELKGRIIGREGRNIRALQEATGVDFIVDDTPETIVVSGFDPVRREVARLALERLVSDGRIHPTRIEEAVSRARDEVDRQMGEAAQQAMDELGVTRVHPELAKLLGQLRYRYSYAQNVLKHSVEAGYVAGLMAGELGLSVALARRAGLLHDVGKAVSHEVEGGHAMVGGRLARKLGEEEPVANAVACHHDDEPCTSVYGHLVTAADALSGARPGARREMLESYVKRLGDLERISSSYAGVERAYAIQAGREVRVVVEPSEVSDEEAALLAREITRRIEEELVYPGQIRVTVVRETRAVDYAK